jgi:hypothetical protein
MSRPEDMTPEELEEARRAARIKRRTGFAFAFVAMLGISVPMMIGAFGGVQRGEVYDPYTGELLQKEAKSTDPCLSDAEELIVQSGQLDGLDPVWDDRATDWFRRCRAGHEDVYLMLNDTRRKLRERSKSGNPAD